MKVFNKPCFIRLNNQDVKDRLRLIGQDEWREPYERADAICASMHLPFNRDARKDNGNWLGIRLDVCERSMRTYEYIDCGTDVELFIKTASSQDESLQN